MELAFLMLIFFIVLQFIAFSQDRAEFYFIISEISRVLVIYFLLLTFEIFYKNTQFSRRQTIYTILVFLIIGGFIAKPQIDVDLYLGRFFIMDLPLLSAINLFKLLFYGVSTIFICHILLKSRKNAWNSKQKFYITWLLIGSLIGILIPSFLNFITDDWLIISQDFSIFSQVLQAIPQSISIFIVGLIFYKVSNNLWLLQHQRVYFLIIYSHSGLTLYSKSFSESITSADTQLLAGAFSAVSSLIKDGTKTTGSVEAILLEGKLLKIINRKKFICALLVEYSTPASEEALENFVKDFEIEFNDALDNVDGEVTPFHDADKICDKYFT